LTNITHGLLMRNVQYCTGLQMAQ
ncbi:hypothetical protein BAE44_0011677, partial [Dichanthelium oligosanthes]